MPASTNTLTSFLSHKLRTSPAQQQTCQAAFNAQLQQDGLPSTLEPLFTSTYFPLACWLAEQAANHSGPFIAGINGAQGSGKSTLARLLTPLLTQGFGLNTCILSIDDLYHTRATRQTLAQQIHPLLATRGVPGTHDIELGLQLFNDLRQGASPLTLPRFNKALDDRCPTEDWPKVQGPIDILLFEGWCIGAQPQTDDQLTTPCNLLERDEDPDGQWRHYANQQLQGAYQALFNHLDCLLMLKIPSFDKVLEWRWQQEQQLQRQSSAKLQIMDHAQITRFIMHYERLTRHMLTEMPARADLLCLIDDQHRIAEIQVKSTL